VSGGAGGYIKDREEEDRLAEKTELRRLQQEQALQLQAQRQQDRIDMFNLQQLAKGQGAGGSSGAGGSKDFNLTALVYDAVQSGDPRKMAAVEAAAGVIGGDEARQWARYQLGGGAQQQERMPTEQDVIASMATDGKEYTPEPPPNASMGQREAAMGLRAFQRGFAIANDPGKYDDFTKGEKQAAQNDLGVANVIAAGKAGKSAEEVGNAFNRVANPAPYDMDGSAKTARQEYAAKATEYKADKTAETAEANRVSAEIRSLQAQITQLAKAPQFEQPEDRELRLAQLESLKSEISALRGSRTAQPQAPVAPSRTTISKDGRTATGTIQRPIDAVRAAGY
jgi:hypothetical protein